MTKTVELAAEVVTASARAVLLDFGDSEVWVPKTCIHDDESGEENGYSMTFTVGQTGDFYIAEWFAVKEDLL